MLVAGIVMVVVAVLVVGALVFWLLRRIQEEAPGSMDAEGRRAAPDDQGAFEDLLQDEIRDRGMEQPRAGDES